MGNSEKKVFSPEMYLQSREHVNNTNPVLSDYFNMKAHNGYIYQDTFSQEILQLPSNNRLTQGLFRIFSSSHNVMTKEDLEMFFTVFTSSIRELQALLITELIFESSERLTYSVFKTNFAFLFPELATLLQYIDSKIKGRSELDKESSYKMIKHKLPQNFAFIKQHYSTSMKDSFNDSKVYICE